MPVEVILRVQPEMPKAQDAPFKVAMKANINEAIPCG